MPSSQAWGQLTSVMRYLRTSLEQSSGTNRLKDAARMLETLEREENQRYRRAQIADAVIRRRVLAARDAFRGIIRAYLIKSLVDITV